MPLLNQILDLSVKVEMKLYGLQKDSHLPAYVNKQRLPVMLNELTKIPKKSQEFRVEVLCFVQLYDILSQKELLVNQIDKLTDCVRLRRQKSSEKKSFIQSRIWPFISKNHREICATYVQSSLAVSVFKK